MKEARVRELRSSAPLKMVLPSEHKGDLPVKVNLSEAASLGKIANEMAAHLVECMAGLRSNSAKGRYQVVRRFMIDLSNTVAVPIQNWSDINWEQIVNDWIMKRRTDDIADTTANSERTVLRQFFRSIWRAQKVDRFEFPYPIERPQWNKKPDLASIVQSHPFEYSEMSEEQAAIARQLEKLTNISDPDIHLTRLTLLVSLMREHASSVARVFRSEFDQVRAFLEDDERGIDVEAFLSTYMISLEPLAFRRGWRTALRHKRDRTRFLCHKEIYRAALLSPEKNCVKKWLSEKRYGLPRTCSSLHATIQNVMPIMTLVMLDLDLEESSALRMTPNSCLEAEDGKSVWISWVKARSGEMQSELRPKGSPSCLHPESTEPITAFQALVYLADLRERLGDLIPSSDREAAFIVCNQYGRESIVHRITDANMVDYFTRFLAPHPILRAFHITPDKLRGTGVLEEHLSHGDLLKTRKRARHRRLSSTERYTKTVSAEHQDRAQVREVQDLLLMNALPPHSELLERLGLDKARIASIGEQAKRSGFLEWFPTPGVKRGRKPKEKLSDFMEMALAGEHIILEDPEVAAEFFAYRQHLIDERDILREAGDWDDVWAPMIILLTKFLEAMRADVRLEGEKIAADHEIEYVEEFL
ncbi:hypothetical protein [Rhizobium binae]|uniref:hypothetical protein n=1 Tax=Rhizobium binae TaxID=1138190 RepID=UPI001C83BB3A|nr:hypothetical protein [Rhizobium binae]MBX4961375.1 hypothetical protein [Rhizobium binae]